MLKQNLIKRLRSLRNLELFNIVWLPACLYVILSPVDHVNWPAYALAMACVCIMLAQGALYWHVKLHTVLKYRASLPAWAYRIFPVCKRADMAVLSLYPILYAAGRFSTHIEFEVSFWSNAVYVFAVLEYVNYYYYQLSHDNKNDIRYLMINKKIRRAPLWKDMLCREKSSE